MFNCLGRSVYINNFEEQKEELSSLSNEVPVFLSLHISEEFSESYCDQVIEVCEWLWRKGFHIITDISPKTVVQFREEDVISLADKLHVWALRIDYGFSVQQICQIVKKWSVVLNASTIIAEEAAEILIIAKESRKDVFALHNFYPRPETGLDDSYFGKLTERLQNMGIKVLAFAPGDTILRQPLFERLPTLEKHRYLPPSVGVIELKQRYRVDGIFIGDPGLSVTEYKHIDTFFREGCIEIPAYLQEKYKNLYGRIFTCRVDSPSWIIRFQESREYSCCGDSIQPEIPEERRYGSITIDNYNYGRYSGEIQMVRDNLPANEKINIIGHVNHNYYGLLDSILPGCKFKLVEH